MKESECMCVCVCEREGVYKLHNKQLSGGQRQSYIYEHFYNVIMY